MRLFTAIGFSEEVKRRLSDVQRALKEGSIRGNYTLYENLHLTLVFLGEVAQNRVGLIQRAIADSPFTPFALTIKGIGRFRRDGGDIVWAGLEANKNLQELHGRLCERLVTSGFSVEERSFKPHLTLAREVKLREGFALTGLSQATGEISTEVTKISLMKSERLGGKLTYTDITGL
jgi:2'-5' RNA ligase